MIDNPITNGKSDLSIKQYASLKWPCLVVVVVVVVKFDINETQTHTDVLFSNRRFPTTPRMPLKIHLIVYKWPVQRQ